ncbi:MAG: hypothetical protein H0V09_03250, partial [Gemmatimonadetes bacterium]|nr:hypothetical protein [Gemmatimonadota bacterium]
MSSPGGEGARQPLPPAALGQGLANVGGVLTGSPAPGPAPGSADDLRLRLTEAQGELRLERDALRRLEREAGRLQEKLDAAQRRQRQTAAELENARSQWETFEEEAARLT